MLSGNEHTEIAINEQTVNTINDESNDESNELNVNNMNDEENEESNEQNENRMNYEENTEENIDELETEIDAINEENDVFYECNEWMEQEDDYEESESRNIPLFLNCPITKEECAVAILSFALRHNVTAALLLDLLNLIALICPSPNYSFDSLHKLKKFLNYDNNNIKKHNYCEKCEITTEKHEECPQCSSRKTIKYFIEMPLLPQIKLLFSQPSFLQNLQYRFQRENSTCLLDIYDGKIYKELNDSNGMLNSKLNISLSWYTDGISPFKSSKFSVWPFFFIINELEYKKRYQLQNLFFFGLWFGEKKPIPNLFLRSLHDSLKLLYEGISVKINTSNIPVTIKGIVICGTCDLPAKALFLNMIQSCGSLQHQESIMAGILLEDSEHQLKWTLIWTRPREKRWFNSQQGFFEG
ncbi:uncharacterized protein [Prorops nasuta]|uniref:uncharacterized protein n=1 Tax=Prorops nasuta TaxID=863751 RepID=UPI0034CF0A1F